MEETVSPNVQVVSYMTFMNARPHSFSGLKLSQTETLVLEKMEHVFEISKCVKMDRAKTKERSCKVYVAPQLRVEATWELTMVGALSATAPSSARSVSSRCGKHITSLVTRKGCVELGIHVAEEQFAYRMFHALGCGLMGIRSDLSGG
ncbi:hypothetical protein Tco_0204101 [Tanacetum coccineum]